MTFKKYIEQFCEDMGLGNEDIADIMGVGPVTFDNYRRGYSPPGQKAMSRLIRTLGVLPDDSGGSQVLPAEKLPFDAAGMDGMEKFVGGGFCTVRVSDGDMTGFSLYPGSVAVIGRCPAPKDGDVLFLRLDGRRCFRCYRGCSDGGAVLSADGGEVKIRPGELAARLQILGRVTAAVSRDGFDVDEE